MLVAVVAVGRFGQSPTAAPSSPPSALAGITPRVVAPRASLTVLQRPVYVSSVALIGSSVGIRSDTGRFDDGIPAVWEGDPVLRVRDAAALSIGSVALVAGWARRAPCPSGEGANPCLALLSDVPFRSTRVAALALGGQAAYDYRDGPRIFRASVQSDPSCTFSAFEACLPRLIVGQPLWDGDDQTQAGPVAPDLLLGALASRFPTIDFQSFDESSYCPVSWPIQSYFASAADVPRAQWPSLAVRLVVVYPNAAELEAIAPTMRAAAAAISPFDASNRCVAIPGGVDDGAWVVRDNVMILLGSEEAQVRATVNDALDEVPRVI